jgi:putative NIF3 family GTP cyclohydrolase 1 type 2
MKCLEIHEYFRSVGPFINWDKTGDSFTMGDPEQPIRKIATIWKPTLPALQSAHEGGANFVISHESLLVRGGGPGSEEKAAMPTERDKVDWLKKTGLVVYRCHDLWDRFPDIGIRFSWQKGLDLGGQIIADQFPLLVTELKSMTVKQLALHVLDRIRPLGQDWIAVTGNLDQVVSRLATGTGVTTDPMAMWSLGADVGIVTDDYFLNCREGAHALERGFPLLTVNHGIAEEWGVANIAVHLREAFPQLQVSHIPQSCQYRVIH